MRVKCYVTSALGIAVLVAGCESADRGTGLSAIPRKISADVQISPVQLGVHLTPPTSPDPNTAVANPYGASYLYTFHANVSDGSGNYEYHWFRGTCETFYTCDPTTVKFYRKDTTQPDQWIPNGAAFSTRVLYYNTETYVIVQVKDLSTGQVGADTAQFDGPATQPDDHPMVYVGNYGSWCSMGTTEEYYPLQYIDSVKNGTFYHSSYRQNPCGNGREKYTSPKQ